MTRAGRTLATVLALALGLAAPAAAHHVGAYAAKDNAVSANFKQLKFSIQAGKFGVALRLFDEGALRKEMRAQAARLPAGLEDTTRAALQAGRAETADMALAVFFAALARDLALEADRRLAHTTTPAEARVAAASKFLEAIWRYYNLVDFVISQRDNRSAVAIRLAFDEAEGYLKSPVGPGPKPTGRAAAPDPEKIRASLRRVAQILADVTQVRLEESSPSPRRNS